MPAERLSERAYRLIKEKIVTLALPPAQVIDEQSLMRDLGLGRTPIREALLMLAKEGLVVILPRRGTIVSDVRLTDLQKIFELRLVLEGYCARLAAQRITAAQLSEMEAVLCGLDEAADGDPRLLMDVDRRFHELLYRAAGNEYLEQALTSLYALSLRLWHLALERTAGAWDAVRTHIEDLEALKARDGERAERLIRDHIEAFQQQFRAML